MKFSLRLFLALLLMMVFPLFFFGLLHGGSGRMYQEVWNMGHVLFFGGLTYFLMTAEFLKTKRRGTRFIYVAAVVLIFAAAVEAVQVVLPSRTADLQDFLDALAGGGIVLLVYSSSLAGLTKKILFLVGAVGLACFSLFPLWTIAYDEICVYRSFPVLSGLESPYEIERWSMQKEVRLVTAPVKSGKYALQVRLAPGKYPGISLQHFPTNWKNATSLQFSIFNPGNPFVLSYRLHDSEHEEGVQRYNDRFNDKREMHHGWNTVRVPMAKVKSAPATRLMDLESMRNLTIFLVNNEHEKLFFVDDVQLIMNNLNN